MKPLADWLRYIEQQHPKSIALGLEREVARDATTVRLRPELVVEIAFNDLQESPHYPAGLALRFARVKGYRPDRRPEDADTIDTVREIYRQSLA